MAIKAKPLTLFDIKGGAEEHEVIHTTNKVIKGVVAVGAVAYGIPCA
jgi:hypothetical protein